MNKKKYVAISIKHTEYKWKFGMPCVLWGYKKTEDNEKRCFSDYTIYPNRAEVYSLQDWVDSPYDSSIIKFDEPVFLGLNFCKKWKKYDTVLVDYEMYLAYCKYFNLPLDRKLE